MGIGTGGDRWSHVLKKVLEHAKLLLSRLIASIPDESTDKVTTASLISNIDANVKVHFVDESIDLVSSLPVKASTDTCERQKDLDDLGVKLWNTSTRLLRFLDDGDQGLKEKETVVRARVLAFLLLEYATAQHHDSNDSEADDIRLLKVAFKTAQDCIDLEQLDLALTVLEKAAAREDRLSAALRSGEERSTPEHDSPDSPQQKLRMRLSVEYLMLRVALCWRQRRLDITEHFFAKIPGSVLSTEANVAETLADLCYDIGSTFLAENDFPLALRWLERSKECLERHRIERYTADAVELRLSVLHGIVRANMALSSEENSAAAAASLKTLEKEYGHRIPVMLLKLEMIARKDDPDYDIYHENLCILLRSVPINDSNMKMLLYHIYRLKESRLDLAIDSMEQLVFQRLALHNDRLLLEKGFITYLWMQTSDGDSKRSLEPLSLATTKLYQLLGKPFDAEATYASLILLWKRIDQAFVSQQYNIAEKWCNLARHSLFGNSGEMNKAKMSRKLLACALARKDTVAARAIYADVSKTCKAHVLTIYLMHSVALLDDDIDLAKECLESLCKNGKEATLYLQACVAEAQKSGKKHHAALALQRLVHESGKQPLDGLQIPVLLRCTARILFSDIQAEDGSDIERQICDVFDTAAMEARKPRLPNEDSAFSLTELEWFSRNSYNLAVQHVSTWEPGNIERLLRACISFINCYPPGLQSDAALDVKRREMLCLFLGTVLSMAQARAQDDLNDQKAFYDNAQIHSQSFRQSILQLQHPGDDLSQKHRTLLAFDFEATVRLERWDCLHDILEEARRFVNEDDELYSTFADVLLCSGGPIEIVGSIFQQIITHLMQHPSRNIAKLSRWIRCVFQLSLDNSSHHPATAEAILDQAYTIARDGHHKHLNDNNVANCYPGEELEWLATTVFNRAVDFYLASDDGSCRRWAQKALDLAGLMHDRGFLYGVLRGKMNKLELD